RSEPPHPILILATASSPLPGGERAQPAMPPVCARATNSVLPSPLWGGSAHAGKLAQPAQAWLRCAGVGGGRWRTTVASIARPPPPTPPHKGEGSTPSGRAGRRPAPEVRLTVQPYWIVDG